LKIISDVDRPEVPIAVGLGLAYDLYLTRTIRWTVNCTLFRPDTGDGRRT